MRREVGDKLIGKRAKQVVRILLLCAFGRRAFAARHDRVIRPLASAFVATRLVRSLVDRLGGFVLGPDIAALDMQRAIDIDADEGAGNRDLGGIIDKRLRSQGRDLLVDRLNARSDFVGDFVRAGPLVFEPVGLFAKRFEAGFILLARGRFCIARN